jgi:hypothetical protein
MNTRLLIAALLTVLALPALAHNPSVHRRVQPVLKSCVPFEGKEVKDINLKDPEIKAEYDKCERDKKLQKEAADAAAHDDY